MLGKRTYPRTQNYLLFILFLGDASMSFLGLLCGYWVRFWGPLTHVGISSPSISLHDYWPLIGVGTLFFTGSFAYLKIYDGRLLLRSFRTYLLVAKSMAFWFVLFLGVSLALKFEPAISRIFVATSCLTTFLLVCGWRWVFMRCLERSVYLERIIQRVVIVGWSPEADQLVNAITNDRHHPYALSGYVRIESENRAIRPPCPTLGDFSELDSILSRHLIDILIVADPSLTTEQLAATNQLAERHYVQFKVVPSSFRIFLSSLNMQTISGVPVLGIDRLRLTLWGNAMLKRTTDIVGALVGIALSMPVIIALSILITRESPGPVLYRQVRTGRKGKHFTIFKLRSMRLNAEVQGAQWAVANDDRRLKIGAFMRKWNLDELPQFWNVLIGEMSLVGPRPERPELIERFQYEIPFYNTRHGVRPGLSGWAQVNGLRGNTSLEDRINYDLYYIENWSLSFDFSIMVRTFIGNKNAY
jgi:exopolysaccharide biosynthesis polyprenyl glycosylphosphotransferase